MNAALEAFTLATAARAAGTSNRNLRAWVDRGVLPLAEEGHDAEGRGSPRIVSRVWIYTAAVTARLVDLGLSPSRAAKAAFACAYDTSGTPYAHRGGGVLVVSNHPDHPKMAARDEIGPETLAAYVVTLVDVESIVATVNARLDGRNHELSEKDNHS